MWTPFAEKLLIVAEVEAALDHEATASTTADDNAAVIATRRSGAIAEHDNIIHRIAESWPHSTPTIQQLFAPATPTAPTIPQTTCCPVPTSVRMGLLTIPATPNAATAALAIPSAAYAGVVLR